MEKVDTDTCAPTSQAAFQGPLGNLSTNLVKDLTTFSLYLFDSSATKGIKLEKLGNM